VVEVWFFSDYRSLIYGSLISMASFRVATYNVHKCEGLDRRRDPARIATVIRELHADIVGLQEVDNRSDGTRESAQMDFLAEATRYEAVPGPTIKLSNGHYGNVLLTRWPVLESREIDLCFSCREPRGAIEAILSIHECRVRVIVAHLGLAGAERRYQIGRLVDCLGQSNGSLTILLGDINEWIPVSRGLRRIHRMLGKSPALLSFPSWLPFLALDRIWVRPKEVMRKIEAHRTNLSRMASDHLPVVAEISGNQRTEGT
jgi:endonuclease/exonuclease/phosphatase family metal-dependent hydrolase